MFWQLYFPSKLIFLKEKQSVLSVVFDNNYVVIALFFLDSVY